MFKCNEILDLKPTKTQIFQAKLRAEIFINITLL